MKSAKYFTPVEAKRTLPLVRRIVCDIINAGNSMKSVAAKVKGNVLEDPEIQNIASDINNYMIELEEIGCFYKDWNFSIGLIDFPSIINNKEVMLCWRSDEDDVKYYHELDAGYYGRKLIPEEYYMHKNQA
jgi:hypothetical protein